MKRIAECHGANNVWLKRWRNNALGQQWYFDEVLVFILKDLEPSRVGAPDLHVSSFSRVLDIE
jgi:hypothetical protein